MSPTGVGHRPPSSMRLRAMSMAMVALSASGCATMSGQGFQGLAEFFGGSDYMTVAQGEKDPCTTASKEQEVFANSIAAGVIGAVVGGGVGLVLDALIGRNQSTGGTFTLIGATVGLAAGLIHGYHRGLDSARRQCDVYQAAAVSKAGVAIVTLKKGNETIGEMVISPDDGHFEANSDQLTAEGVSYYQKIARQYTYEEQLASYARTVRSAALKNERMAPLVNYTTGEGDKTRMESKWGELRIILTGHTDDQKKDDLAVGLSERRARNVASLFKQVGVPESLLHYQGAGSAYPIADNNTSDGRKKNNRVEVVVVYGDSAVNTYAQSRTPDYELFSEMADGLDAPDDSASRYVPPKTYNPASLGTGSTPAGSSAGKRLAASSPLAGVRTSKPRTSAQSVGQPPPGPRARSAKPAPSIVDSKPPARTAASPALASSRVASAEQGLDFGGAPVGSQQHSMVTKLGTLYRAKEGFSLAGVFGIGVARATSTPIVPSCAMDSPLRYQPGAIKRYSDGAAVATKRSISSSDSYLGIIKRSYSGPAGNHYVEVKNLSARQNGDLANAPQFNVYLDFQGKSAEERLRVKAPDLSVNSSAIAVRGDGGLLVRQFFADERGLICLDMLIPNDVAHKRVDDVALYYTHNRLLKAATMPLER